MLEKTYSPATIEAGRSEAWQRAGAFAADPSRKAAPFSLMMPPPNVTGSLHIGHALNHTLQDVIIRWRRMMGRDTLWQPGTDHAGIATQMVVERQLDGEGTDRRRLGREKFLERVWGWKALSGGTIVGQLRRLGTSPDWGRERFTMDEGLSAAVRKVFVRLHGEGLIYRDRRLVNWDPKLHTAISDLEVENRENNGHLWHFRYPLADDPERHIVVATTRPETMLGDTAVAVHPEDTRYQALIGKTVRLPLVGREIPIIADEYADPDTGSGAVKITPAHDFNDFEVGKRHDLAMISIFDEEARINDQAPEAYRGLDRFVARQRVVADIDALGLLERIEDRVNTLPYGDRSGVVIEPFLTDQWYVDAKTLAAPAIKAVEEGRTRFVPKSWENTYFAWMRDIQPWCISRQLWWGHRIPAWYGPDGAVFVAETEEEAQAAATRQYGEPVSLSQDEDVLDTWFSSALWPFSTLGWPEQTVELSRYYPTDTLVTSFDIIFFWVARMMMMGLHFMGEVPFRDVYIHALVRDEKGQKMSKSKGNIVDPISLIDRYGADALRFTMAAMAAQGRDIKLAEARVEGYRNFATKLWNAARYAEMNGCSLPDGFDPAATDNALNRWIVSELVETADKVTAALENYRFNDAAGAIYSFTWGTFCDWYLEFTKPVLTGEDAAAAAEVKATTAWIIKQILHLLHPFMPFLTEELAEKLSLCDGLLAKSDWPALEEGLKDADARSVFGWVVDMVQAIRALRADMNVPAGAKGVILLGDADAAVRERLRQNGELICRLARLERIEAVDGPLPDGVARTLVGTVTLAMPLAGLIDIAAERARLQKERDRLDKEVARFDGKLANASFLERAPADVIAEQRDKRQEAIAARDKIAEALASLPDSA